MFYLPLGGQRWSGKTNQSSTLLRPSAGGIPAKGEDLSSKAY